MADGIKNKTKIGVMEEVTEGVWLAPASATSYFSPSEDGMELNPSSELLERNVMTGNIGKLTPRMGMKSVSGSTTTEARSSGTPGQAPQYSPFLRAALGSSRTIASTTTTKDGNTSTVLQIEDADIAKFQIGDIIMVKQEGAFHVSPIIGKTIGTGTATITLLNPHPAGAMEDNVVIEKCVTYVTANEGHPTLSISKYTNGTKLEKASGVRVTGMELQSWTTQQLAAFNFTLEGLKYDQIMSNIAHTPTYDPSLPAVVKCSKVWVNGAEMLVNEVTVSLENTLAKKTATSSCDGAISSVFTGRSVSGSFNPYKSSSDINLYTMMKNETEFSLFSYIANPTGVEGEFKDVVAYYLPKCLITEATEADQDGLLQESVTFSATRGTDGTSEELYISVI